MTPQSLCEIWEQYPYGPSGQKISPRVLFKQNQRNHDPYTSELQKAYKRDYLVNRHNMMGTVSKLYVSNNTWIYVYIKKTLQNLNSNSNSWEFQLQFQLQLREFQLQLQLRQVSWISTPTPTPGVSTPTPTPANLQNINSNSNSGGFNSNSNSGVDPNPELAQGHKEGIPPYRFISFSFHVNRPSHSWDTAILKFDIENSRSRSWVRSKF